MTEDDLRTRIAAVLTDEIVNEAAIILRRYGASGEVQLSVDANALADAVIRELGIREEKSNQFDDGKRYTRITSKWTADK